MKLEVVQSSCVCGSSALQPRDLEMVPPYVRVPCSKADDSRDMFGIGHVVDLVEIYGPVHGISDSVIPLRDGDVIGLVLFTFVGEVLLQKVEAGIVATHGRDALAPAFRTQRKP